VFGYIKEAITAESTKAKAALVTCCLGAQLVLLWNPGGNIPPSAPADEKRDAISSRVKHPKPAVVVVLVCVPDDEVSGTAAQTVARSVVGLQACATQRGDSDEPVGVLH
jgi:hypothetical protein